MSDTPRVKLGADGVPIIPFDAAGENWLATVRLEKLRSRGWRGTFSEYARLHMLLDGDPLEQAPPITSADGYNLPPE
jgi:hypothetical protein